jgi:hypothetical protein
LSKLAPKTCGLKAETCDLLEGWLQDQVRTGGAEDSQSTETGPHSILLSEGLRTLPHGNYPVLNALFLGYLNRKPSDADGWLGVLERHSSRREAPEVWATLAYRELSALGRAERGRAAAFIRQLLEKNQEVLNSEGAVHLIARSHAWLPPSLTHFCLAEWETGAWANGPQAAAETAMVRHALTPDDDYCRELVERVVQNDNPDSTKLKAMRIGLAFLAAEIWGIPQARPAATRVLLGLLPNSDVALTQAWLSVFHHPHRLLPDKYTQQILDIVIAHPQILQQGPYGFIVDRIKELLEDGVEHRRACLIVTNLLNECGGQIGDVRTAWAASAGDLIDIALTLQRFPDTRSCGLDTFERLMDLDAYKVSEVLGELDRRLPR